MELSGTIKKLFETQQVSPTFRKREVVIETDENYPQVIMCEFTQDRADIPSRYNEGDKVGLTCWVSKSFLMVPESSMDIEKN